MRIVCNGAENEHKPSQYISILFGRSLIHLSEYSLKLLTFRSVLPVFRYSCP